MAITINGVRFSYCHLFQPVSRNVNEDPKYSTTILLPKSNAAGKAEIDRAIEQAANEGVSKKWNGVKPPYIAIPIHDGDGVRESGEPFGEECKGCWVFTASSKQAPFVVDAQVQNIINPQEVYSGMYGNVNVTFFPYNSNGRKGVGCGLNGVQKVRDGEPLSGRVTAAEAFKPVAQEAAPASGAASGGYLPQGGYSPAPVQNSPQGYPAAPQQGYAANPQQTQQGAAGYGSYPQPNSGTGYGVDTNAGYGTAPGYGAASNAGYGGYANVDPTTGEVLNNGYAPSGMPIAGI